MDPKKTGPTLLPWQHTAWSDLQRQLATLPHAILLHGAEGIGKVAFAEALAQSLLCEQPAHSGHACQSCAACTWFKEGNHPDYRRIRPEILEDEVESPGEADSEKTGKSAKAPSKEIKIDQIRALAGFVNVSTHRRGRRVVLIYPAESLNQMAANALLKTLEEPPPDSVFLLVTHRLDRLLPTIVSRCRKLAMPFPPAAQALSWLEDLQVQNPRERLAESGGAPLAAMAGEGGGDPERFITLIKDFTAADPVSVMKLAERLQKQPMTRLVASVQRLVYDVLSFKLSGTIRYYPAASDAISLLAARSSTPALLQNARRMNERRAIADHPLSPRLFIEDMLLDLTALFQDTANG